MLAKARHVALEVKQTRRINRQQQHIKNIKQRRKLFRIRQAFEQEHHFASRTQRIQDVEEGVAEVHEERGGGAEEGGEVEGVADDFGYGPGDGHCGVGEDVDDLMECVSGLG